MKISFKESQDYFYNAVHPSGYKISLAKNNVSEHMIIHSVRIEAVAPDEQLERKKISLYEMYMDIEEVRKSLPHPNIHERELIVNDDFLDLINKYGFLTAAENMLSALPLSEIGINDYERFMDGQEFADGKREIFFNEEELSRSFGIYEGVRNWIFLLERNPSRLHEHGSKKDRRAVWQEDADMFNLLVQKSTTKYHPISNSIYLEPNCLASAYLFFALGRNITGKKRCDNCEKEFVDTSRSSNQKFCSDKCKSSAYRQKRTLNMYNLLRSESARYDLKYSYPKLSFSDISKKEIKGICNEHGDFIVRRIAGYPPCPFCQDELMKK